MSAIRTYVDGRPTWRKADDGAVGRMSSAGSIRGSLVVGESERDRILRVTRERLDMVDRLDAMDRATTRKNPDNGAVEASITEVQR